MRRLTRRQLLTVGSFAATGGLAGCSTIGFDGKSHPRLGKVRVTNFDSNPHTVHLDIEFDGEIVTRESYDLDAYKEVEDGTDLAGGASVDPTWPCEPAPFAIRVRVDGEPGPVDCDGTDETCAVFESEPTEVYMRCVRPIVGEMSPPASNKATMYVSGNCTDWEDSPCSSPDSS